MNKFPLITLILILFVCSCVKEDPEPDPEQEQEQEQEIPVDEIFSEATIGPEGGELATEDFILIVPDGAFETSATLKLVEEEENEWTDPNQVTELYRLEGLNIEFSKPLEFRIRYEGTLEGESAIALGFYYFDEESEDSVWINELLSGVDSSGYLRGSLAPLDLQDAEKKSVELVDPLAHPLFLNGNLLIRGLSGIETYQSEYAEIRYYSKFNFQLEKVQKFAEFIDEAVNFFHDMKVMDKSIFNGYKFRVNILDEGIISTYPTFVSPYLENVNYAQFSETYKKLTKAYMIRITRVFFADADEHKLRMVAAEGVLRFENYCYFGKMDYWLQYAILYWARRDFLGDYQMYAEEFPSFVALMLPYYGMNTDMTNSDNIPFKDRFLRSTYQGMGMSPLIRYLMGNYNENKELLYALYTMMMIPGESTHSIDILLATLETPENVWWPGFFKAYLEGKIWPIPVYRFQEKIDADDQVNFSTEADTVKYLDRMYPDLSARLFQFNFAADFSDQVLGEGDKLRIKIEPEGVNLEYVRLLVHSFVEAQPVLLGEGDELVIEDLKEFIDGGNRTLLITVVNSTNESPYLEEMEIQLTARIEREKTWFWKYVSIEAIVDAIHMSNTGDETTWDDFRYSVSDKELNINEDGTLLYTTWLDQLTDYKYEGGINIDIDPVTYEITGFYVWSNSESYSDGMVSLSEQTVIQGKEGIRIPVVYQDGDYLDHQLSGTAVCPAIESWTYTYAMYPGESYEYTNTLVSYSCSENAALKFFWSRENLALKQTR